MEEKSRLSYGVKYRIALLLIALIGVWEILNNNTTSNALVNFLFGGIVPGTDIVLSPNTVIFAVMGVAFLSSLALVIRQLIVHRRLRRADTHHEAHEVIATEPVVEALALVEPEPETEPEPMTAPVWQPIVLPVVGKKARTRLVNRSAAAIWRTVLATVLILVATVSYSLRRGRYYILKAVAAIKAMGITFRRTLSHGTAWLSRTVAKLTRVYWQLLATVCQRLRRLAVVTGSLLWRKAIDGGLRSWRWVSPYLWRFDHWLEQQVHQQAARLDASMKRHETASFLLHIGGQATNSLHDVKPLLKRTWQASHRYADSLHQPRSTK